MLESFWVLKKAQELFKLQTWSSSKKITWKVRILLRWATVWRPFNGLDSWCESRLNLNKTRVQRDVRVQETSASRSFERSSHFEYNS